MKIMKMISALLFPARCAYCNEVIIEGQLVCDDCKEMINYYKIDDNCPKCACRIKDCTCGQKSREYVAVTAPYYYRELIKNAVHNLKFFNDTSVKNEMANKMYVSICDDFSHVDFDFIIPVPLSKKRLRQRGYNQSELLAKQLSQKLNVPLTNTFLVKIFDNEPQHNLSGKLRRGNVSGVYECDENADFGGSTVLLIDDVMTTGETLNECAKMLKLSGVSKVYCCVFGIAYSAKKR